MWGNNAKKKVLVLNGSPKLNKSSTMVITNAFLEGMKMHEDYDLEIIHVQSLHVKPCIDCLSCWGRTEGECIIKDDDVAIVLHEAFLLIFLKATLGRQRKKMLML